YSFRIIMQGEAIKVYMDGVPYFEVTDNEYSEGYFGMFADRGLVDFANIGSKPLKDAEEWDTQYAIWNEADAAASIRTDNVIFEDPEDDPVAELAWELHHTPRFLNNQGLSALDGETITAGTLELDNVGDYVIALKGRDDPNLDYSFPDMTFDDYRKDSNEFTRKITVHRRPIADFDVTQQASDGKILWTDYSRDPDRYESNTKYSTEDTGIDYKATKGIMEKRFYHVTPSGAYIAEKLVAPQETGTYEIGMAVKDEYGAWSEYHVVYLTIGQIATPNTPPTPGFTTSKTSTYRGDEITINSTASDTEDGDRTHLPHTYYVKNTTTNSAESIKSTSRTSWSASFEALGTYTIRQLVEDSDGASAQIEHEIAIVNRKPTASVTVPASTNQNSPTKLTVLRPEFQWSYADADGDEESKYQIRVYRYGGIMQLDSGVQDGDDLNWPASADLPEHVNMYVQVRVYDGYDWGEWSAAKYFYIETNQPPTADFTWSPEPVYEGDSVEFRSGVADPDHDTLHAVYEVRSPAGATTSFTYHLGYPYTSNGPSVHMLQTGNWQVKLTVDDGKAPPVIVQKTVQVRELSVDGEVRHTDQWNERRQSYNRDRSGNEDTPRGYSVFWAGEKFLLKGTAVDTGTAVKATKLTVDFEAYSTDLTAADSSSIHWTGELWEPGFEQIEDGPITFLFTAYYNNGTVKTTAVTVEIKGNVNQLVGVHRVR
ncbi:hypothetical protein, partial [Paenibacillus sp. HB172176]|uniref:glycoside hydrolase family 78 protein n=1 Tax=Paenibacillus sp. HB172176 TaxID=2493690 RepID=UPI00143BF791